MKKVTLIITSFVLIAINLIGCTNFETVTVTRIIDGDTFVVDQNDIVRIVGINAPERKEPCFFESTQYLQEIILGKKVKLLQDSKQGDRDNLGRELSKDENQIRIDGRLLRYVFIEGEDVGKRMISDKKAMDYNSYAESVNKTKLEYDKEEEYNEVSSLIQCNVR